MKGHVRASKPPCNNVIDMTEGNGSTMQDSRPAVIAVATPKGGAGKTMVVILLACESARNANRVLIVDADPQGSASKWFAKSKRDGAKLEGIACEIIVDRVDLVARLKTVLGFDLVLVDLQGTAESAMSGAIALADLVVIPSRAHVADSRQAVTMARYVAGVGVRGQTIPHCVLINAVDIIEAKTEAAKAGLVLLAEAKLRVLKTALYNRPTFKNVATSGSLYEVEPATPAVKTAQQNVVDVMNELIELLEGEAG